MLRYPILLFYLNTPPQVSCCRPRWCVDENSPFVRQDNTLVYSLRIGQDEEYNIMGTAIQLKKLDTLQYELDMYYPDYFIVCVSSRIRSCNSSVSRKLRINP